MSGPRDRYAPGVSRGGPARAENAARVLVVLPSWIGDAVMATPALRLIRARWPGAFVGGLARPGIDQVLAGTDLLDQVHVERARGVMGPKLVARAVRPLRYGAAVLLTNSFSSALVARLAFIPRRIGYDRDGRGLLLTDRLSAPRRASGGFAPVPAVEYYLNAARALVGEGRPGDPAVRLELGTTAHDEAEADRVLREAGVAPGERLAILNPGANDPAKRWPAERFVRLGLHLGARPGLRVLVNGGPGEHELVARMAAQAPVMIALPALGLTLGTLKAVIRRAALLVTNDTGPRHIAAAFGVPTVTLFGPTDPRWTSLPEEPHPSRPGTPREIGLVADPSLPPGEVADEHPERCRIERIELETVVRAAETLL